MARNEFFADVRRAVSWMAPRVEADSPFTDVGYTQKMLRSADLWITPSTVAAFNLDDFADVDEGRRDSLFKSVDEFRRVAAGVNPRGPALPQQRDAALSPFTRIVQIVRA
jgi:hypothetical protein